MLRLGLLWSHRHKAQVELWHEGALAPCVVCRIQSGVFLVVLALALRRERRALHKRQKVTAKLTHKKKTSPVKVRENKGNWCSDHQKSRLHC